MKLAARIIDLAQRVPVRHRKLVYRVLTIVGAAAVAADVVSENELNTVLRVVAYLFSIGGGTLAAANTR